ncbi:HD domain-containing protein [Candidatus Saccharibacteria bacterium]|nr:HD domain-containing protein [Candidatus Saccharibacteria bacterium]
MRSGLMVCGATTPITIEDIYHKPEFVAEHEGRVAFLYALIMMYHKQPFTTRGGSASESLRHVFWLLSHDIGEMASGDQPDDGTKGHSEARPEEDKIFNEFFDYLPGEYRNWFERTHDDFESYGGTVETQFDKALDKVESILYLLFLKEKGVEGDTNKKNPPSKQDQKLAKLLGTSKTIDVWCLHYRIAIKHLNPRIIDVLDELLVAAFSDIYRTEILENGDKLPKCLTMDVTNLRLD